MSFHEQLVAGLGTDEGGLMSFEEKLWHPCCGMRRGRSRLSATFGVAITKGR